MSVSVVRMLFVCTGGLMACTPQSTSVVQPTGVDTGALSPTEEVIRVGCEDSEFSTVNEGVVAAQAQEIQTIEVCPGVYSEADRIRISDDLNLKGLGTREETVLEMSGRLGGFYIDPSDEITVRISNLTIAGNDTISAAILVPLEKYALFLEDFEIRNFPAAIESEFVFHPDSMYEGPSIYLQEGVITQTGGSDLACGRLSLSEIEYIGNSGNIKLGTDIVLGCPLDTWVVRSTFSDNHTDATGSVFVIRRLTNLRVEESQITDNRSQPPENFGGGGAIFMATTAEGNVEFVDSEILRNETIYSGQSIRPGVLTAYNGRFESINTDWGVGENDNSSPEIRAGGIHFNVNGRASFVCTSRCRQE